jgi:ABC-type branched-subunit amino acid transport system permease subunit
MLIQAIREDPSILEALGADPGFIIRLSSITYTQALISVIDDVRI